MHTQTNESTRLDDRKTSGNKSSTTNPDEDDDVDEDSDDSDISDGEVDLDRHYNLTKVHSTRPLSAERKYLQVVGPVVSGQNAPVPANTKCTNAVDTLLVLPNSKLKKTNRARSCPNLNYQLNIFANPSSNCNIKPSMETVINHPGTIINSNVTNAMKTTDVVTTSTGPVSTFLPADRTLHTIKANEHKSDRLVETGNEQKVHLVIYFYIII